MHKAQIKKTKDSRHKHSTAAQFFVMVFFKKPRQKAIIYAASAFVFFSCIANRTAFFFFLFSFGKYFKQKKQLP